MMLLALEPQRREEEEEGKGKAEGNRTKQPASSNY
jgi:hypothetical protein